VLEHESGFFIAAPCMFISCYQSAGQNYNIKIGNRAFENVAWFKYLGTIAMNQNLIHDEIKSRLNLGNACYHSCLLSKNVKTEYTEL
jgi:hypothetical protein